MVRSNAILHLYLGLVNSMGLGEGEFYSSKSEFYDPGRDNAAIKLINQFLGENYRKWAISYGHNPNYGFIPLVKNENEAEFLTDFARKNIQNSSKWIVLHRCAHGKIVFSRQIKIFEATEDQKSSLINRLKESGYIPQKERCWEDSLKFFEE